jgi:hypothetical protein
MHGSTKNGTKLCARKLKQKRTTAMDFVAFDLLFTSNSHAARKSTNEYVSLMVTIETLAELMGRTRNNRATLLFTS